MKKIKFVYNNKEDLAKLQEIIGNKQIEVEAYDETVYKERKKAFSIKNSYGARMLPFLVLQNENNPKPKVFFTESGDVLENFKNYLNGKKKIDVSVFIDFVKKCKEMDLDLDVVKLTIETLYKKK